MDWITDTIAIGNIEDAMNTAALDEAGITAILCLNGFPQQPALGTRRWVGVTLIDGEGNSPEEFESAVDALRQLTAEHRVLVHCMEGRSRSVLVVSCYLSQERSIPLDAAIEEVTLRRDRAQVDFGLLRSLGNFWPIKTAEQGRNA